VRADRVDKAVSRILRRAVAARGFVGLVAFELVSKSLEKLLASMVELFRRFGVEEVGSGRVCDIRHVCLSLLCGVARRGVFPATLYILFRIRGPSNDPAKKFRRPVVFLFLSSDILKRVVNFLLSAGYVANEHFTLLVYVNDSEVTLPPRRARSNSLDFESEVKAHFVNMNVFTAIVFPSFDSVKKIMHFVVRKNSSNRSFAMKVEGIAQLFQRLFIEIEPCSINKSSFHFQCINMLRVKIRRISILNILFIIVATFSKKYDAALNGIEVFFKDEFVIRRAMTKSSVRDVFARNVDFHVFVSLVCVFVAVCRRYLFQIRPYPGRPKRHREFFLEFLEKIGHAPHIEEEKDMKQLENMSVEELDELIRSAEKHKKEYDKRMREEAKRRVNEVLREYGFKLGDLFPRYADANAGKPAPADVEYRDPDNPSLTWTGKGRKPKWLKEREEAGEDIEDFRV